MPEELGLILIVLGVAGWIIYAITKAAIETTSTISKGIIGYRQRFTATRAQKKKERLQTFVRISLPAELDRASQTISGLEAAFADRLDSSKWAAQRPMWQKVSFKAFTPQSRILNRP